MKGHQGRKTNINDLPLTQSTQVSKPWAPSFSRATSQTGPRHAFTSNLKAIQRAFETADSSRSEGQPANLNPGFTYPGETIQASPDVAPVRDVESPSTATEDSTKAGQESQPLQRKIGAEIEVVGATLEYEAGTEVTQGEKVGAIVPGIETEIHLEGPKNTYATFEMATGLHGQYPPENPLSLTFQVAYLADFVEIAKMRGSSLLKDMPLMSMVPKWAAVNDEQGPTLRVDGESKGAFQVNVSPTKETSSTFLDIFDVIHSLSYEDDVLKPQVRAVNNALFRAKQFSTDLYKNILALYQDRVGTPPPSILKSTIKALVNVPRVQYFRYLRDQEGWGTPTLDIIDKNILEVLPRANIRELWLSTLQHDEVDNATAGIFPSVLEAAFSVTPYPELASGNIPTSPEDRETYNLLQRVDQLINEKPEGWMEQVEALDLDMRLAKMMGKITTGPNIFHADALKRTALADTLAVLRGDKILIKKRGSLVPQAEAILKRTDSSLLSVNKEEGEAGVFEVRNPFTHMIPVEQWAEVMAAYEAMLLEKGVRY